MGRLTSLLRIGAALALLVLLTIPALAQWSSLEPGLEYRHLMPVECAGESMHQVRIDLTRFRLGLLYAPDYGCPGLTSGGLASRSGAVVVVNAAYFDESWQPMGYLSDGLRRLVTKVAPGNTLTGVFLLSGGAPSVIAREQFVPGDHQLVVQAGPRLVVNKKPVSGLVDDRRRRRAGIGIDTQGRVVLFASGIGLGLTLQECQNVLLSAPAKGGIEPVAVLNLDGGRSTQMTISTAKKKLSVPGMRTVPVALAVYRRAER